MADRIDQIIELLTSILTELQTKKRASKSTAGMSAKVKEVVQHYRTHHPTSKATEEHKIKARLDEGFTVDHLKEAIDGCHLSPFHKGDNQEGRKYLSLELIMRNATKVDTFRQIYRERSHSQAKPKPRMGFEQFRAACIKQCQAKHVSLPSEDDITKAYNDYLKR